MMNLGLIAAIISLAVPVGAQADGPISNMALKLDADNDHVAPLPLSASEATRRFGNLEPGQVAAIRTAQDQLFSAMRADDSARWTGPALMLSISSRNILIPTDLTTFRKELAASNITLFDPYSCGHRGGNTYSVVMGKMQTSLTATWVAIAFVLHGMTVKRIVLAPQPWIKVISRM